MCRLALHWGALKTDLDSYGTAANISHFNSLQSGSCNAVKPIGASARCKVAPKCSVCVKATAVN